MVLNLGRVSYINALPLFCAEPPKEFSVYSNTPNLLNDSARSNALEIGMVSRWIYPQIEKNYRIIKNFGIFGDGEILSIRLFSKFPLSELGGKKVFITSETGSSSRAFRFLCLKKFGFDLFENLVKDELQADAILLIGNSALTRKNPFEYEYDLGKEWKDYISTPMLYAVFVARRDIDESADLILKNYLKKSLQTFFESRQYWENKALSLLKESTGVKLDSLTIHKYYDFLKFELNTKTFEEAFEYVAENGNI